MYLILNDKLVLFGNYLIKRFDILFGFINQHNLVFFCQQHTVPERGGKRCYNLVSERGSDPALTRDGDLWDLDFNDFQCFRIGGLKKKKKLTPKSPVSFGQVVVFLIFFSLCRRRPSLCSFPLFPISCSSSFVVVEILFRFSLRIRDEFRLSGKEL